MARSTASSRRLPQAGDAARRAARGRPRTWRGSWLRMPATPCARIEKRRTPRVWPPFANALEEALGIKFEGEKGEHFFRSTLVQTLFYGVFSAWVLWTQRAPAADATARFDWREAAWSTARADDAQAVREVADPARSASLGIARCSTGPRPCSTASTARRSSSGSRSSTPSSTSTSRSSRRSTPSCARSSASGTRRPRSSVHGRARRHGAARGAGHRRRPGRPDVFVLDPCCGTGAYLVEVLDASPRR